MLMVFAAGSWNWHTSSASTESIYVSCWKFICERERDVFGLAKYACHRTYRPAEGGGTAILVRRGIDQYAVPVLGLTQLEASAIHIMLASGPLQILAVYLLPSRPIVGWDLSACFGGQFPVLMAVELNSKHIDRNSRMTTTEAISCVMLAETPV
jgi:hypothetical protein